MKQYMSTVESPMNTSLSKQKYSFSRAPRITHEAKSDCCAQTSYNLPGQLGTRMAGIGYGQKDDISKHVSMGPAPNQYQISCFTDYDQEHKKGVSLGLGRDDTRLLGIWGSLNTVNPGPGRYQISKSLKDNKFSFGLRPELINKMKNPGPGYYEASKATSEKGDYFISRFHNSGAAIIGKDKERFKTLTCNNNPEPGRYSLENLGIKADGIYPKQGYRSVVQQSFGKAIRKGPFEKVNPTPGPGAYKQYSEFN